MPLRSASSRFRLPVLRSGIGAMLCLLVILCGLLASSESAHAWVHGDSDSHGDTCAACLFAAGGVTSPGVEPLMVVEFRGRVIHTITATHQRLACGCPAAPQGRAPPTGLR